jgi:uncharacterized membrane protein (DUF4010 family)
MANLTGQLFVSLAIALGIGLLVGAERERRKGSGPTRASAGIRTFALASLTGAISVAVGGQLLLAITCLVVGALSVFGYTTSNTEDPGITSELALLTTTLLGAMAIREPIMAAGFAVVVTILLAARTRIHHFVREVLTEREVHDALLFAGFALVILPLTPNRPIGPFHVLNLRVLCTLAVIVMFISSAGYVAVRSLGSRIGLPLTGLAAGFVSSVATIGSMGNRVAKEASLLRPAAAGAVLSTLATVIQLIVVLWISDPSTLAALWIPLALAGVTASVYAAVFVGRSFVQKGAVVDHSGRAFNLSSVVAFAATISAILAISAAVREWFGATGLLVTSFLAGFADTHAVAISVASLVGAGKISVADAVPIVLIGFTTNTFSKAVIAATTGGRKFALAVIPGLMLVLGAAWIGSLLRF